MFDESSPTSDKHPSKAFQHIKRNIKYRLFANMALQNARLPCLFWLTAHGLLPPLLIGCLTWCMFKKKTDPITGLTQSADVAGVNAGLSAYSLCRRHNGAHAELYNSLHLLLLNFHNRVSGSNMLFYWLAEIKINLRTLMIPRVSAACFMHVE